MRVFSRCLALSAALGVFAAASSAWSYPLYRRWAQAAYTNTVRCEMCHDSGGGTDRNVYGKAWQRQGERPESFLAIGSLDSDGDGISNQAEALAASNPGDARSTPQKPGRYASAARAVAIPSEQLLLVAKDSKRFEVSEPDLKPEEIARIEAQLGSTLPAELRYPTLYFGSDDGGKRTSIASFATFTRNHENYGVLFAIGLDGRLQKVAMFRAGSESGSSYRGYLDCLVGHGANDLPDASACGLKSAPKAATLLARTAKSVLITLETLYTK